ncbi:TPA: hypothetical protein N0F65_010524 [Lagenidium giganteum]|uniref:UBC core domain-containing protein n=1 Tax=Lagenidium giganteum TaxID=4803 RepID=A0AAV2ZBF2_9STRA|nr:TPA: hypothetical protein N0F65_010524 [Lagenidium giganteum]
MASAMATNRLRKEYKNIIKKPVENIRAAPLETDILEWHYVITGTEGTPYEGGYYHGKLKFPKEYPMKPPSVLMLTPNGRFEVNRRICLSMSDFHPETWNPLWSVSSILTGLYSFMLEDQNTTGSITTTEEQVRLGLYVGVEVTLRELTWVVYEQKRAYAEASLAYNCADKHFRELFTDLVEQHEEAKKAANEKP